MPHDSIGIVSRELLNLLNAMVGISSLIEQEVAEENIPSASWRMHARAAIPVRGCVDSSETSLTSRALKRVCS